jgi:hypothetical protein
MATNGKQSHTDRIRELAGYIEETEEVTGNVHLHLAPGTTVDADATGKIRAVSNHEIEVTRPDHARPSEGPKSGLVRSVGGVVVSVLKAVNNPYALGALAIIAGSFVAWLVLRPQ